MFGVKNKNLGFVGKRFYTIDEYLEIEERVPEIYEFWNEDVIKLDQLDFYFKESIFNLERKLSEELEKNNYNLFSNFFLKKKKIWIKSENCLFYPDLFVVGDEVEYYPNRKNIITNPLMIIEISTAYSMGNIDGVRGDRTYLTDRASKFWKYQNVSTLKEYVLITDDGLTVVETYNKLDDKNWKYQVFSEEKNNVVNFESVDIKLPVKDIYL